MARIVIDLRSKNLGTVALGHRSYLGLYRFGSVSAGLRSGYEHSITLVDPEILRTRHFH
jgi:hypothetical protein